MFIDWNGNGEFDPSDLALSLAILDDERRREEKLRLFRPIFPSAAVYDGGGQRKKVRTVRR